MRTRFTTLTRSLLAAVLLGTTLIAADTPIARRQPVFCADATKPYPYYQATVDSTHPVIGWYCSATQPVVFNGSSLTATATELNKNAGVTAGTASASKTAVLGANKNLDTLVLAAGGLYIGAGAGTQVTDTAPELNVLHSVTPGTVAASSAVVVNSAKSVDVLQATTSQSVGGTGVPGAAAVATRITKAVTAIADATATDLLTVTVPNAAHSAVVHIRILGSLGAGGAIGANECSAVLDGNVIVARTAGVAAAKAVATAAITTNACVAGATTITLAYDTSTISGTVSATNTFTIRATITKGGGSSANHTALVVAEVDNANATGVTIP